MGTTIESPWKNNRLAEENARLRAYVDAAHGKGSIRHIYAGLCPDNNQPDSLDHECPACRLLMPPNV